MASEKRGTHSGTQGDSCHTLVSSILRKLVPELIFGNWNLSL